MSSAPKVQDGDWRDGTVSEAVSAERVDAPLAVAASAGPKNSVVFVEDGEDGDEQRNQKNRKSDCCCSGCCCVGEIFLSLSAIFLEK